MTGGAPLRLTRRDLDALSTFARGYLHEDVIAEYGSAIGAARAFAADASADDRRRLAAALEALARAVHGRPPATLQRFLSRQVRSAWSPRNAEELRTLAAAVRE
jgi:hypothetical protein